MNRPGSLLTVGRICCVLSLAISACLTPSTSAADALAGTIVGRVYNPAAGEYVRNAEIRLVGTDVLIRSDVDGSFTVPNVPPGVATIEVNYTGYETATVHLNVTAGSRVTADVSLTSTYRAADQPIKMDAYTVSTERVGNAKAIMDQRQAMTVSNIVAAETFGNTSEGNIGEFLKYLPGIQLDYVEADARNPRIRGLPAQYTAVTMEGMDLASADGFIQNNGTDNGGGAGVGGRSFGFEQVSMSSIDAVQVNFTTDASQSAGAAAGSIDLRAKHAFSRSGQRIMLDVSAMGNSEELYWHRTVKPDDRSRRLISPNLSFEYSNTFLNNRLGVFIGVNETNYFNEQRQFVPTYDANATVTDPRPLVITRLQYKDGPKFTERSTLSFTFDFKATSNLTLSLVGTLNNYGMMTSNRNFGVTSTRANISGDGWTSWNNVPITSLTSTWSYLNKRTHGFSYIPIVEYRLGSLTLRGAASVSVSENNYGGGASKSLPGNTMAGVSLPVTGMTVSAWRPADDLYAWRVVQTGGQDWSNLANYKATATTYPTFGWDGRYNRVLKYQARLDATYVTPLKIPTFVKAGANVEEITYIFRNPTSWNTWNYIGPGGGLGGSWGLYPSTAAFSQGHGGYFLSTTGGTPAIPDHNTVGALFRDHPEYFVHADNAGNYYTSFVVNPRYIREQVDSLYAMFDTKPIRRLEFQAGVRWERTRDETKDFDQVLAAQVVAAGYPINATTGTVSGIPPQIASTIPGINYQFFSRPRIARSNRYDGLYPSTGLKYSFSRNLQLLFGYSYTLTRPAFGDLAGAYTENDVTYEITAPNPHLKPEHSNNYTGQLTYFFEPVGKLSVGLFENDIKNFIQSGRIQGAAADFGYTDPLYDTYTVITKNNIPGTVRYRGASLEYQQSLSFLPGLLKGIDVFANYTRLYTVVMPPDPAQLHVSGSPYNYGWVPGIAPHVINAGFTYKYRRLSVGLKARWTAAMSTTSTYNTWMRQNTKFDATASYRVSDHWSVYFNSRNITNVPDRTYVGTNTQRIGGGRAFEYYGAFLYLGVKATY